MITGICVGLFFGIIIGHWLGEKFEQEHNKKPKGTK
jgi:hypothetical protein